MNTSLSPRISWYSAIAVAVLLVFAALAKWLYPLPQPFYLGQVAIFVECLAALLILIFNRHIVAWFITAIMFSLWLGYALFWFIQREPCGCFGAMEEVTSGIGLGLDLFMIALSLINMACLGAKKKKIFSTIICSFLFIISGLWFGSYIFYVDPEPRVKEASLFHVGPGISETPETTIAPSASEPPITPRPKIPSPAVPPQPETSPVLPGSPQTVPEPKLTPEPGSPQVPTPGHPLQPETAPGLPSTT